MKNVLVYCRVGTFIILFFILPKLIALEVFISPELYLFANQPRENSGRISSAPYIAGDSFRSIAQFVIDEMRLPFNPTAVKNGDIIFLKTDLLEYFFTTLHPLISSQYILITHNSDCTAPGQWSFMLEDDKIIRWYAQNADIVHEKLIPIPIGIANRYWPHGNVELLLATERDALGLEKKHLCYVNFAQETHPERIIVQKIFSGKLFCYKPEKKTWKNYLLDMAQSKFVLSPRGNGLDCHRTWEALIMGSIPIVRSSTLDVLYQDLPVVIVNTWDEVTESFLKQKYEELVVKVFNDEKRYVSYWIKEIQSCQKNHIVGKLPAKQSV